MDDLILICSVAIGVGVGATVLMLGLAFYGVFFVDSSIDTEGNNA